MWNRTRPGAGKRRPAAPVRLTVESLEVRTTPAEFTAGDLVLLRVGDGTTALSAAAAPGALVELTTAGADPSGGANVIGLPTFGTPNQGGITFSGSSAQAAALALSADGHYLTTIGYDAPAGTAGVVGNTAAAANRDVARIDSAGTVVVVGRLTDAYSGITAAGAVTTDGTAFYTVGSADGLRYFTYSGTAATTSASIVPGVNLRTVGVVAGNVVYDASTAISRESGEPTTAAAGMSLGVSFNDGYQFVFLDRQAGVGDPNLGGAVDTLYVANGGNTSSLAKYYWTGTAWAAAGVFSQAGGFYGIVGQVNGATADLYLTTNAASNNALQKFTDTAAYNATIAGSTATLATAGANYRFRGIAFAPTAAAAANSAPVLGGANDFAAINEDDTASAGPLVSALVGGQITDANGGDGKGVAVTATNTANGTWEYTTNGITWQGVGTVDDSGALLLAADATTRLRFVPNADFNGTVSPGVTFRAWDQTSGAAGTKVNVAATGGASAFSTATASSKITVNPVNDAPRLTATPTHPTFTENGPAAALFTGASASTVEPGQSVLRITLTVSNVTDGASEVLAVDGSAVALTNGNSVTTSANGLTAAVSVTGTTATVIVSKVGGVSTAVAQSAVNGLSYRNASENPTAANRVVIITGIQDDGGTSNSGQDASNPALASTVTVVAVNDAPAVSVPGDQATAQGTPLVFSAANGNAISVSDPDAGGGAVRVTLTASHGTVTLGGTSGLSFTTGDGTGDAATTFTGTLADINAALDGLTFTPDAGYSGAAGLQADVNDQGHTGTGTALADSRSVSITVAPNQPPTLTATALNPTFTENGSAVALFSGASASAVEAGQNIDQIALTVSNVSGTSNEYLFIDGTAFLLDTGSGTTSASGLSVALTYSGTTVAVTISKSGGVSAATAAAIINGLAYSDTTDDPPGGTRAVTITGVRDTGGTASGGHDTAALAITSTVTVVAVNDPPTLTATAKNPAFTEGGAAVAPFSGAAVSTPEAGQTITQLTLTVSNVTDGASEVVGIDGSDAALTNGNALTTTTNGLSVSVTVAGSLATVTISKAGGFGAAVAEAVVNGLTYRNASQTPTAASRVVTLTGIADDGGTGHGGHDSSALAVASTVSVTAVDDAPVNGVPGDQTTDEDTPLVFSAANGNAVSVSDADAGAAAIKVTLTATGGTVTLASLGGLSFSAGDGTGDATVTFSGSVGDINAALDGLTFTPDADFTGAAGLKIDTDDQGATGSGGPLSDSDTIGITVSEVNDPPTFTLTGDVTVDEDAGYSAAGFASNFRPGPATATDEAAQTLTGYAVTVTATTGTLAFSSAPAIDASGKLTFATAADTNGTAAVKVTAADSGGATSAPQTFTITVNAVNDRPAVALAAATVAVPQDSGAAVRSGFAAFAPGGGPDEATQTPAYDVSAANPGLFTAAPVIDASGTLTFTPAAGASGETVVTVTVRDGGGTARGGHDTSLAAQFTIRVDAAPHSIPVAAPASASAPAAPHPTAARAAQIIAVGSQAGAPGVVLILSAATGAPVGVLQPFGGFTGGLEVAVADVNGDGVDDIVVATAGFAAHVMVFNVAGAPMMSFLAFPGYGGGLSLAAGDVDGDGRADIVVGTRTGAAHVKAFSGATGGLLRSFLAFPGLGSGIKVGAGDTNGDGRADIAVAAGAGGNGHVKLFDGGTDQLIGSFLSYPGDPDEIDLAVSDVTGDGLAEVITVARNPLHGGHVKAFTPQAQVVRSLFAATGAAPALGLDRLAPGRAPSVGAADINGDRVADILVGDPRGTGSGEVVVIDGATGALLRDQFAFGPLLGRGSPVQRPYRRAGRAAASEGRADDRRAHRDRHAGVRSRRDRQGRGRVRRHQGDQEDRLRAEPLARARHQPGPPGAGVDAAEGDHAPGGVRPRLEARPADPRDHRAGGQRRQRLRVLRELAHRRGAPARPRRGGARRGDGRRRAVQQHQRHRRRLPGGTGHLAAGGVTRPG